MEESKVIYSQQLNIPVFFQMKTGFEEHTSAVQRIITDSVLSAAEQLNAERAESVALWDINLRKGRIEGTVSDFDTNQRMTDLVQSIFDQGVRMLVAELKATQVSAPVPVA
jgi:hypothetical protein